MADDPNSAPVADDPQTTGTTTPAPGSPEGQAGGSPPPETDPTSGGDGGEPEQVKELRRKVTTQAEELKEANLAREILERAMALPDWENIQAKLTGQPTGDDDELLKQIFGEHVDLGKQLEDRLLKKARAQILREMNPVVREVGSARERTTIERALKAQGLPADAIDSEAFETFRADFEEDNRGFEDFMKKNPGSAAKWLASEFKRKSIRSTRTDPGDRGEASLERGGGTPSRVGSVASQVKIDRSNPNWIHDLHAAIQKGETPVDSVTGKPLTIKR